MPEGQVIKLVNATSLDNGLTSIADAIRTKGGTSADLTFPDGFVDAVEAIPTGGSSDTFAQICNRTISSYESTELLIIPTNTLRSNTTLTSIKAPNLENLGSYALGGFRGAVIALPGFKGNGNTDGYYFSGATTLTTVDFGPLLVRLNPNFFNGATNLDTLIIRKTTIPSLNNVTALSTTKFKNGGAGGTIYIPKVLYDHLGDGTAFDYKNATNWSTVDGYGTITWAQIEGSIYESQYADGTSIT